MTPEQSRLVIERLDEVLEEEELAELIMSPASVYLEEAVNQGWPWVMRKAEDGTEFYTYTK